MDRLRLAAIVGCGVNAVLLASVQLWGAAKPPLALFLLFAGVWIFGAAMLLVAPAFGALGTTLYGVLTGVQVLTMHGPDATTLAVSAASLGTAALAAAFFVQRRREGHTRVMRG